MKTESAAWILEAMVNIESNNGEIGASMAL